MFEATIRADRLGDAIDAASALVDECRLRLNEEGLSIRAADPAVVAMVEVSVDADAFESYAADGEVIGVDLARLADLAGVADADDLVRMRLDEERRALDVRVGTLSYSLGLIDSETVRKEPDLPDLSPPAEATLSGAQLDRGVAAADMVADHLRLRVPDGRESLRIEAEGDTDDVTVELGPEELIAFSPGEADSLYSLDYLKEMTRPIPGDAPVSVELGTEFLVRLAYEAGEAGPRVSYRLAPRISTT
ncbi:DNA polymerase sliding clamp [Halorubrum sp. SS5]|nr:DNA polymerase sliding clamp [Halorubrum sp. SS5]